jgi:hypothetical protein
MALQPSRQGLLILSGLLVTLVSITLFRDAQTRTARESESAFVSLVEDDSIREQSLSRVEVVLPGGEVAWNYARVEGLWRLPEFDGAFALNEEVDNLVKILLQGRARPIGSGPAEEARHGLLPGDRITLSLFQGDKRIVRLFVGALAPGGAKDERYVHKNGDDTVYLLTSNPAVFFEQGEPPALLDRHILPRALPHGMPHVITFSGSRSHQLGELTIKRLPVDPKEEERLTKDKNAKRQPTHEFIGTLVSGDTKTFDDTDGMTYVNALLNIEFDKIVGSISPVQIEYRKFDEPVIDIILTYDKDNSINLSVSGTLIEGKYPILNKATGQMFVVSSEKVDSLIPTLKAK